MQCGAVQCSIVSNCVAYYINSVDRSAVHCSAIAWSSGAPEFEVCFVLRVVCCVVCGVERKKR